jgi:hypothetical protein
MKDAGFEQPQDDFEVEISDLGTYQDGERRVSDQVINGSKVTPHTFS